MASAGSEVIVYRPIPDLPAAAKLVVQKDVHWLLLYDAEQNITYKVDLTQFTTLISGDVEELTKIVNSLSTQVTTIAGQLPNFMLKTDKIEFHDLTFEDSVLFGGYFADEEYPEEEDPTFAIVRILMRQGNSDYYEDLLADIEVGEIAFVKDTGVALIGTTSSSGAKELRPLLTFAKGLKASRPATTQNSKKAMAYAGRIYVATDENNTPYLDIGGEWINLSKLPYVGNGLTFDDDGFVTVKPWTYTASEVDKPVVPVQVSAKGVGVPINVSQFGILDDGSLALTGDINGGTFNI